MQIDGTQQLAAINRFRSLNEAAQRHGLWVGHGVNFAIYCGEGGEAKMVGGILFDLDQVAEQLIKLTNDEMLIAFRKTP